MGRKYFSQGDWLRSRWRYRVNAAGRIERVAVITQTGDVWNRKVTESTVGDGFNVGNIFGGPNDKYVLSDQKGTIFVVNTDLKCGYMVYRTTASAVGINLTVPDCLVGQMTNM